MRLGAILFVGIGLLAITGACGGPGSTDDACTSAGGRCVDLSVSGNACDDTFPYPCTAAGPSFTCCRNTGGSEGGSGSGGGVSDAKAD